MKRQRFELSVKPPMAEARCMAGQSARTFEKAGDLVRHMLSACECSGQFLMRPRQNTSMKGTAKIRVKYAVGQAIRVTLKPGDNNTAWDYDLVPPTGTDPEALCKQFQSYLSGGRKSEPEEIEEVPVEEPPVAEIVTEEPLPVPRKPEKTLLQRVSELETCRNRIAERRERVAEIDKKRLVLQEQLKVLDDEAMQILKEDEADTEAYESKEILENLERLFSRG